jgi:hypothetical protein
VGREWTQISHGFTPLPSEERWDHPTDSVDPLKSGSSHIPHPTSTIECKKSQ